MSSQQNKAPREMSDDEFIALMGASIPTPPAKGGSK